MPHSAVTLSTLWQFEGGRKSNKSAQRHQDKAI